jgi:hypothetical protein
MSTIVRCSVVTLLSVACGGTSGGEEQGGGAPNGGNPSAGSSTGGQGGNANAGTANGGASSGGKLGSAGAASFPSGGAPVAGVADERCPARQPTGPCTEEQAGVSCQYDVLAGCLCATSPASSFGACTLVDPTCANSGSGGSAKVAPPPRHLCACSSGNWLCNF